MIAKGLWGRVRSRDKGRKYPVNTVSGLNRQQDVYAMYPLGMYLDPLDDDLVRIFSRDSMMPVTVDRPNIERGELALFHPRTNTRIIARNNGNLDIITQDESGNVNITTQQANISAAESVTITSPETTIDGNLTVTGDTDLSSTVRSNGVDISDTHSHAGSPTAPNGPVTNTGTPAS